MKHLGYVLKSPSAIKTLKKDPTLKKLIKIYGENYRWGIHGLYPSLIRAVVGQQIANKTARKMFYKLAHVTDKLSPEKINDIDFERLRKIGLSKSKIETIKRIAYLESRGELKEIEVLTDNLFIKEITKIKGIGLWSAQMALIFGLGRKNVWPLADLGIRRSIEKIFSISSIEEMEKIGDRFNPWKSVAAWYLWQVNDRKTIQELG